MHRTSDANHTAHQAGLSACQADDCMNKGVRRAAPSPPLVWVCGGAELAVVPTAHPNEQTPPSSTALAYRAEVGGIELVIGQQFLTFLHRFDQRDDGQ